MKNKILLFFIVLVILAIGFILLSYKKAIDACPPVANNSFTIYFDNEPFDPMIVCIGCDYLTYKKLPDGKEDRTKIFLGYKVEGSEKMLEKRTSTRTIKPKAIRDEDGCITGYQDVHLKSIYEK